MLLKIATLSKKGGRESNEDACDILFKKGIYCCVLSDGLGGHHGGEVASGIVVDHVIDCFNEFQECNKLAIENLLHAADNAIIREQHLNSQLMHMRATAVVLIIDTINNRAIWGHSGDSRLYCFRQDKIIMQTRDHSVSQNMVDAGYLQPNELRSSPSRNQLYAALGNDHFKVDVISTEFSIMDRDVFLMCSDGLWEYIEENEMERMLSSSDSVMEWLEIMESQVLSRGGKGQDNYSAIAIWCEDLDEITRFP
ncbi:MAG: protein phosphatase 2C domain-containing protein [Nitrosomonas sp.]|nr:protein phosphatase 2C domain-containing protein [Nitrosomonas sp.]